MNRLRRQSPELKLQIGAMLRAARNTVGMSIAELARRADVNPETLSCIERGEDGTSIQMLESLAGVLGGKLEFSIVIPELHVV